ncbi:MAG: CHRD domain-containing protein [Alphaproteobacteria bacterium]|nr:CHRD domain-containing protein [Alphaproteobacteria bacterium]
MSRLAAALALGLSILAVPAVAATSSYQTNLGPMPLDDETKAVIAGRGDATAVLDGRTVTIKGDFHGLPSNATEAHVFTSPVAGVPGKSILDLDVTKSTSGTISGTFSLSAQQVKDLRTGKLYIQINSENAPPGYPWGPKGTLWGWLFPAHETVGPNVPQEGHWFIPQLDTPKN